jgi:hypothetical protein
VRSDHKYMCCFCGLPIEPIGADVGGLLYSTNVDRSPPEHEEQQLWCHAKCLVARLHPSVKLYALDLLNHRNAE